MVVAVESCKYIFSISPQGFSGIIYNLVWGLCQTTACSVVLNEVMSYEHPCCDYDLEEYTREWLLPFSFYARLVFFTVSQSHDK